MVLRAGFDLEFELELDSGFEVDCKLDFRFERELEFVVGLRHECRLGLRTGTRPGHPGHQALQGHRDSLIEKEPP